MRKSKGGVMVYVLGILFIAIIFSMLLVERTSNLVKRTASSYESEQSYIVAKNVLDALVLAFQEEADIQNIVADNSSTLMQVGKNTYYVSVSFETIEDEGIIRKSISVDACLSEGASACRSNAEIGHVSATYKKVNSSSSTTTGSDVEDPEIEAGKELNDYVNTSVSESCEYDSQKCDSLWRYDSNLGLNIGNLRQGVVFEFYDRIHSLIQNSTINGDVGSINCMYLYNTKINGTISIKDFQSILAVTGDPTTGKPLNYIKEYYFPYYGFSRYECDYTTLDEEKLKANDKNGIACGAAKLLYYRNYYSSQINNYYDKEMTYEISDELLDYLNSIYDGSYTITSPYDKNEIMALIKWAFVREVSIDDYDYYSPYTFKNSKWEEIDLNYSSFPKVIRISGVNYKKGNIEEYDISNGGTFNGTIYAPGLRIVAEGSADEELIINGKILCSSVWFNYVTYTQIKFEGLGTADGGFKFDEFGGA